jgi:uncharacterized membrane protein
MPKESVQGKSSFGLPALLAAIWAVVLLAAFFAHRGSDVGQLGQLIGNLGGGPLAGSGVFDSFIGVAIALAIAGAWLGVGHFAISFIPVTKSENHSHVLEIAVKMAVGAAIWALVWFFLGIAGAYSWWIAIVAVVIGPALLSLVFRRVKEAKAESRVPDKTAVFDKIVLVLIAVPLMLALIASLASPTAKDTLLYHFSVPKVFIAQGSNAVIEGNIASYMALGTEMHTVWAMLLGGMYSTRAAEAAGGAVTWAFFPLLLMAVFGWAREIGASRRWALVAVLMVASVPTVYHVAASGYIDVAWALFITLAIYTISRWWRKPETGWVVFTAIFLGAALSAKLLTIFVIAAFALVIVMRAKQAQAEGAPVVKRVLLGGFGALVLAGVFAFPMYLRTWIATGSPVFPFYMSIWPGEAAGWDMERSNLLQGMNSQYGGYDKTPLDYLLTPWNLSVVSQPEQAAYFDGVLGVGFLFGLPLLIWALWKFELPVEAKIGAGVGAVMFLFWMSSSQQLRYLLPILPVLAIGTVLAGEAVAAKASGLRTVVQAGLIASSAAGILVAAAWFMQKAPLRVVLGGEPREAYLTRNIDYYPYYQWLNRESAADVKVWLINMRRDTYHLERPYFSDYLFEDWTLRKLVWEARNAHELKARAAAMGVQYILTRHDFLFDYERSPLVDDTKPRAENEARLRMARELVLDPARTVRADNRFSLVRVF